MSDFYKFLAENRIEYERHDHPPVYTVEEAGRLVPTLAAAKTKNLFLRDKKGLQHFLVVVAADKRVDLKALPQTLGSNRLSFGSADRLKKYLGVEPGSVTLFAIFNDPNHAVELIVDESLWHSEAFQFHPLVNTSTLVISRENLKRFIAITGHEARLLDIPSLEVGSGNAEVGKKEFGNRTRRRPKRKGLCRGKHGEVGIIRFHNLNPPSS